MNKEKDQRMSKIIGQYLYEHSDLNTLVDLAKSYDIPLNNSNDIKEVISDTMKYFDEHKEQRECFPWDYNCDFVRVCNICHDWMQEGYYAEGCSVDGIFMDGYWCSKECLNTMITDEQWDFLASEFEEWEDYKEAMQDPYFDDKGNDSAYYSEWYAGKTITMPNGETVEI